MAPVGGNEADGALVPFGRVERDLDSVRTGRRSRIQSRCKSSCCTGAGIEDVCGSLSFYFFTQGVREGNDTFKRARPFWAAFVGCVKTLHIWVFDRPDSVSAGLAKLVGPPRKLLKTRGTVRRFPFKSKACRNFGNGDCAQLQLSACGAQGISVLFGSPPSKVAVEPRAVVQTSVGQSATVIFLRRISVMPQLCVYASP